MVPKALASFFSKILKKPTHLSTPGLYHFVHERPGERTRLHLRVDPDGRAVLIVNAGRILHLNPSAAMMAHLFLEGINEKEAIKTISKAYNVPAIEIEGDYTQFAENLALLIRGDGPCPACDLNVEVTAPFTARPAAPYRMDLALTYRCNDNCAHCYNARPRDYPELPTRDWIRLIDRLWEIGIPHIVFTGGEPTLRDDLSELIAHAERNGQITGLNTNGRRLHDPNYVEKLVQAGLDHVQITVESHNPQVHDTMVRAKGAWKQTITGLRNALDTPLFVMTNTTMLRHNSPYLAETLEFLGTLGVPTIGLNALIYSGHGLTVGTGLSEKELPALLDLARRITSAHNQRLIWYTPTQYCNFDPMQLELGVKGCTAALYNMCVEPDGGVLPCQSYYQPVGNLLSDPWESIWNHELCLALRKRSYVQEKCHECVLLAECGGGCPLVLQAQDKGFISIDDVSA